MRSTKAISITLSPDLNEEIWKIARTERKSISDILREALRQYAANRAVSEVRKQLRKTLRNNLRGRKIGPDDVENLLDEKRT